MYTTCVIWLAFVPLYFGIGNHTPLRITTMSVTISLSASVTIVCLFSPKVRTRTQYEIKLTGYVKIQNRARRVALENMNYSFFFFGRTRHHVYDTILYFTRMFLNFRITKLICKITPRTERLTGVAFFHLRHSSLFLCLFNTLFFSSYSFFFGFYYQTSKLGGCIFKSLNEYGKT